MSRSVNAGENNVYLVDNIVDRRVRRGRVEYRVRWKGFPPEQDSWEPFTSLREPCFPLIQEFHNRYRKVLSEKRRFTIPVVSTSRPKTSGRASTDSHDFILEDTKIKQDELSIDKANFPFGRTQLLPRASRKNFELALLQSPSVSTIACCIPMPTRSVTTVSLSDSISFNSNYIQPSTASTSLQLTSLSLSSTFPKFHNDSEPTDRPTESPSTTRTTSLDSIVSAESNTSTTSGRNSKTKARNSSTLKRPPPTAKRSSSAGVKSGPGSNTSIVSTVGSKCKSQNSVDGVTSKQSLITLPSPKTAIPNGRISSKPEASKDAQFTPPTRTNSQVEGTTEPSRKSVTIMLKTCPTEEFHSTKELQTLQSSSNPPSSFTGKHSNKKRVDPTVLTKKSSAKPGTSSVAIAVNDAVVSMPQPVPDSHVAKVMDVVLQLRESRRRPVLETIQALCYRQYNLSGATVLAALNFLVAQGQLHEIPFANGISYRSNPRVVARGDLCRTTSLSAKIKAKYVSAIKGRGKKQTVRNTAATFGCKRVLSGGNTAAGSVAVKRSRHEATFPGGQSRTSLFGRILKPKSLHESVSRATFTTSRATSSKENYQNGKNLTGVAPAVYHHSLSQENIRTSQPSQNEPRIFVVPPASPSSSPSNRTLRKFCTCTNDRFLRWCLDTFALNITCNSSGCIFHTSELTVETATKGSSGGSRDFSTSSAPGALCGPDPAEMNNAAVHLRRSSARQTEAVYKFKSILVKKNVEGRFTEVWLQSPGSSLKNAFTIQVLEELTVVLNQAVYDTSRLVVISGMGTVFSSGIDLTILTGPLPNRFYPNSASNESSSASSMSSGAGTGSSINYPYPVHSSLHSTTRDSSVQIDSSSDPMISQQLAAALRAFLLAMVAFPKPIVAGVNGPAMGLAVAILPLCDLVYVSDAATLQLPYTQLGQTPEGGVSFTLCSLIGLPSANELLLAGRKMSAREAMERGLVSDLLYPKSFKQELIMRCHKLATASSMALEMIKCIIRTQHRDRIEFVINTECRKLVELWQTAEFRRSAVDFLIRNMGDFL
ncbi:hypothetical protein EG68_09343 [Paragonimus skrjabini miyazakii]|uniref:Chromo domain-containing protein n=1 Tax=Paragonimus skrjabini miyazakii TaxID=59628 RepID=A0A8S9YQC9_9TREM|nr:hypothetical protein EG68_09343 [Paragonimus skrjabini miyazakii]